MSGISWTKKERARSKAEKKPLFAVAIDSRESSLNGSFFNYAGVGDDELLSDIIQLVQKHAAKEET